MSFNLRDLVAFLSFVAVVIGASPYAGRKEENPDDYFLAGRGLSWWLIGSSLIASNILTEHFVGMAGRGYALGMTIGSDEWMAAVTLVVGILAHFSPRRHLHDAGISRNTLWNNRRQGRRFCARPTPQS